MSKIIEFENEEKYSVLDLSKVAGFTYCKEYRLLQIQFENTYITMSDIDEKTFKEIKRKFLEREYE